MFKVASLFSGAGGLDAGFAQISAFRIVFANEVLASAAQTYSKNFGLRLEMCRENETCEARTGVILKCDVSRVDFSRLKGEVDVVLGGPPCQDFSIVRGPAWDRRGIEVKRGRLYAHFVRALAVLQPKVFVFENVPGLMSANGGLAYKTVVEDFQKLNLRWDEVRRDVQIGNNINNIHGYYLVYSGVVDFAKFGVPQHRERLIIIGVRGDLIKHDVRFLWEVRSRIEDVIAGRRWLFRKYPLTAIEVFEGKPLPDLQREYDEVMQKWEGVWDDVGTQLAVKWKREVWDKLTMNIVRDYLTANGVDSSSELELEEAWAEHRSVLEELKYLGRPVCLEPVADGTCSQPADSVEVCERLRRIPPGENHEFVRGTKWEVEGRGISLVYRRIHPLKPSYTIVAYGGGGTHGYHYDRDRATLNLRERARLQTFPDSFFFCGSRTEIRAQIGEAVPPLAGKRIAEAVEEILRIVEQA